MPNQETNPAARAAELGQGPPAKPTDGDGKNGDQAARTPGAVNVEASFAARQAIGDGQDAAQKTAQIAEDTVRSGLHAAMNVVERSTDEFKQTIDGWTRQGEDLARRSRQNLQAIADCNSVVARGMQDISRAWIDLAQARVQRSVDSLNAFARFRTAEEFVATQSGLLHDNLEQIVDTNRRVAQLSLHVMEEAAQIKYGSSLRRLRGVAVAP